MARNSFVTQRAEAKVGALANLFAAAAGERWVKTDPGVLRRTLLFSGFHYLNSLQLVYNWENRFMSVSYNLQMVSVYPVDNDRFEQTGDCLFTLHCTQKGLRGKRTYSWKCGQWKEGAAKLAAYRERLANPLVTDRLAALDIMEMEIQYKEDWGGWRVSCESIIGSATWLLIPPAFSMVTPKLEECVAFLELYELLGDALVNNTV